MADYTSPDIQIAWVAHEGEDALLFGKHPWHIINSLDATRHYENGAGDLLVQIFIHVVKHQAPPETAAPFPAGLSIEWLLPDEDDPQKQDGALMIFHEPTLANVARYWELPLDKTPPIVLLQMLDQIERLAKRQFGASRVWAEPAP